MLSAEKPEAEPNRDHSKEVVTFADRPFLAGPTGVAFQEMLEEEMVSAFGGPLEKEVLNELRVLESEIQMGHEVEFEKRILKRLRKLKKEVQKMKNCLERNIMKKGEHRDRRPDYAPYVAAREIRCMMERRNREAQCTNEVLPFGKKGFCGALLLYFLGYDAQFPTGIDKSVCPAVNRFWTRSYWKGLRIVAIITAEEQIPAPEGLAGGYYDIDMKVVENKRGSDGCEETEK